MYVTAQWVQAFNKDLGTNIYGHRGLSPCTEVRTADDAERIANSPGPRDKDLTHQQIPPRMNRVLAYVDVVLDEQQNDDNAIAERIRLGLNAHNASTEQWHEHNGVFVRFFLQPYMSARMDTYETLRAQLNAWLDDKLVRLRAAS